MTRKELFTSFVGRIARSKWWTGVGIMIAVGIIVSLIDRALGTRPESIGVVGAVWSIAALYFWVALNAKRWHDRGKSGWWSLLILVPIIGWVWILVELGIMEGTRGPNQYGPDPIA